MGKILRKYRNHEALLTDWMWQAYAEEDERLRMKNILDRAARKMCVMRRSQPDTPEQFKQEDTRTVGAENLITALEELGWEPTSEMMQEAADGFGDTLNKEEFNHFIQKFRLVVLKQFNLRAGFSSEEVGLFREAFDEADKSGDGILSLKELMPVLVDLGKEPRTIVQRDTLSRIIEEVDEDGNGEIEFHEFLQMMRKFVDESDADQLKKEKEAIERTGFSREDVASWRDIFVKFDLDGSGEYDSAEVTKLLNSVGIKCTERTMYQLFLQRFAKADEDLNNSLDFPEFMLLICDLVEIDFCGIASLVSGTTAADDHDDKKQQKRKLNSDRRKIAVVPKGEKH